MTSNTKAMYPKPPTKSRPARTQTRAKLKKEILLELLSRKSGADVPAISKRLGWQHHTTRAALSRLRKTGVEITCEKSGNGQPSRYRITAGPAE